MRKTYRDYSVRVGGIEVARGDKFFLSEAFCIAPASFASWTYGKAPNGIEVVKLPTMWRVGDDLFDTAAACEFLGITPERLMQRASTARYCDDGRVARFRCKPFALGIDVIDEIRTSYLESPDYGLAHAAFAAAS